MNHAVDASGMNPWICVLLITSAGSIGGLLNAYMSDKGFTAPSRSNGIWCPGTLWNVFVGGISAATSWALYGSGAGIDLANSTSRDQISLRLGALAGALIVGMAGSKWLMNEVDRSLWHRSVVTAARKNVPAEKCNELELCNTPRQTLQTLDAA